MTSKSTLLPARFSPFARKAILATGIASLLTASGWAADITLTASDAIDTSSFNSAGNWSVPAAPAAGNDYFTGAFGLRTPTGTAAHTFAGDSLTLSLGGSLAMKGSGIVTINNLILNGGTIGQAATGGTPDEAKIAGTINVLSDSVLDTTTGTGRIITISSKISGNGGLRITGTGGTVNFTEATNDYTGVITLGGTTGRTTALAVPSLANGGELSPLGASTSAASNLIFDGGILRVTGVGGSTDRLFTLTTLGGTIQSSGTAPVSFTSTQPIAFSGAGARTLTLGGANTGLNTFSLAIVDDAGGVTNLTKADAGTWVVNGANTYTGRTTINGGVLEFAAANSLGATTSPISMGGGTLRWGAGNTTNFTAERTITLTGGTSTLNTNGNSVTVASPIDGTGALTKGGGGILTLTGVNTFSGNVNIGNTAGAIRITNSSSLGTGQKTVTINSNVGGVNAPSLRLDGSAGSIQLPGSIAFSTSNDTSTPALINEAGNNIINGNFTLTSGGGGTRILVEAGSLTLNGNLTPNTAGRVLFLSGPGDGVINGVLQNQDATNTAALTKDGTGTWLLNGPNTYTGATNITAGTLITTTASTGAGAVTVANGANFGVRVAGAGQTFNTSNLTVNGTTASGLSINLGVYGNPTVAPITATAFNPNGVVNVGFSGANLTVGQFKLIDYTTLGGGGFPTLALALPPRTTGVLVDNAVDGSIDLNLTAYDFPKWTGADSTAWNTTAENWREVNSGLATTYIQGVNGSDSVLFDDTATVKTVVISDALTPANVLVNTAQTYTFSGAGKLSGTGDLVKQGTGTLILATTGGNDYGNTTITQGTVQIGDGTTAGAGQFGTGRVENAGTIAFNRPDDFTVNNVLAGAGNITKAGAGTLTLAANNAYSGTLQINAGTVRTAAAGALGSIAGATIVASGGTLDVNGMNLGAEPVSIVGTGVGGDGALVNNGPQQLNALRFVTLTGNATIGGTSRFDMRNVGTGAGETLDLAGHTLTKEGANMFSLVGITVTPGDIVVNEGTFNFETTTTLQGAGTVTANPGSTLQFYQTAAGGITRPMFWNGNTVSTNGQNSTVDSPVTLTGTVPVVLSGNTLTLNGVISGAGGLTKTGGGALLLAGTDANTYTGLTTIEGGTLRFGKPTGTNALGGDIVVTGTANIAYVTGSSNQLPDTATLTQNGTNQSVTLVGETLANAIVNATAGGQIIANTGVNITNQVTINSGVYAAASSSESTAAKVVLNGGTLRIAANGGPTTLNIGAGGITAAGGVIEVGQGTGAHNAVLNLGGDFTATADILINDGGYTGANLREVNLGAEVRTFNIAESTKTTINADIAGAGGLTKTGAGTLELSTRSTSTYTGATNVDAGILLVQGALGGSTVNIGAEGTLQGTGLINAPVLVQGSLEPGAAQPGALTLGTTNLTFGSAGSATLELGSLTSFDRIAGIDLLTLDGTVAVSLLNGYSPLEGDTFDLFDFATMNASGFAIATDLQLPALGEGLSWNTDGFLADGTLMVVPEPGSFLTLLAGMGMVAGFRRARRR